MPSQPSHSLPVTRSQAFRGSCAPPKRRPIGALAELEDLALLDRLADRRPEALAELYDRYSPLLLGVTRRILGCAADAEEALQEALLQVWNQAERYDPSRSSISTWLVLIARSRALDRLRKRRSRSRTLETAASEPMPAEAGTRQHEVVLRGQRRRRLRTALAALPVEQRTVLDLAFFHGLSQSEIAERTATPLGTVKTRSLLAIRKVRRELRQELDSLM